MINALKFLFNLLHDVLLVIETYACLRIDFCAYRFTIFLNFFIIFAEIFHRKHSERKIHNIFIFHFSCFQFKIIYMKITPFLNSNISIYTKTQIFSKFTVKISIRTWQRLQKWIFGMSIFMYGRKKTVVSEYNRIKTNVIAKRGEHWQWTKTLETILFSKIYAYDLKILYCNELSEIIAPIFQCSY